MKKSMLLLMGALVLSSVTLTSCGEETVPLREDWTEAETESIKSALRGVMLPFFELRNEYTFNASTKSGQVVITMEDANVKDLKAIEKAFQVDSEWEIADAVGSLSSQPYVGDAIYTTENININGVEYLVGTQYGLYTSEDDFGVTDEGTLQFVAFLQPMLEDYSDQYTTYEASVKAVEDYFKNYGVEISLPSSIVTSASSYEITDMRYVYYYYYQKDIGTPYAVLDFYDAKEEELSTVNKAFEDLGYTKKTQEATSSSSSYDYYFKDGIKVVPTFEVANASYNVPDRIELQIFPASK